RVVVVGVSAAWGTGPAAGWGGGGARARGAVVGGVAGSRAGDQVGSGGVPVLAGGTVVVRSTLWHNGAVASAGAVTFGDGTTGISGVVSAANSLVGSTANDNVGSNGVTVLANAHYVVGRPHSDNEADPNSGAG